MLTYFIYNFILFSSTLAARLHEKTKSRYQSLFFLAISFFIPFIFLALRYNIGNDYRNYVDYFYKIASGADVLKEQGYIWINQLIAYYDLDVQWLFVFFGFFWLFFSYKALPKVGFSFGVFLLITISYLYEGFSAIRQGLAIAILTYALQEKSFFRYFVWVVFAAFFHIITAILFLMAYPMMRIKLNRLLSIFLIIGLFILMQFTNIAEMFFSLVAGMIPKYAWYLNNMQYAGNATTSYGLIGPMIKISIALPIIYFQDKTIKKFPEAKVMINFTLLYIISYIFHLKISIFGRVEHAFIMAYIISIVYFAYTFKRYLRFGLIFFISLFYYLMFLRYISNGVIEVDNDVFVNPYQTVIFDREGNR